jgi:hypothetical protein
MVPVVLPLVAAVAVSFPEVREFWTVRQGPQPQPVQAEVRAHLMREGEHIAVYQEEGYHFSILGEADETTQIAATVNTFDEVIYPREVALFGPCPDVDGNGKVIVLLTKLSGTSGLFFSFDEMPEKEALANGFHSNHGEVLYQSFDQQGNRVSWNIQSVAETFHQLLHYRHDPGETAWRTMLADYTPYMCGLASARLLWGDFDPEGFSHSPADPWNGRGWSLLFVQYLRDKFGPESLRQLVDRPENGMAGLAGFLRGQQNSRSPADLLGDFAMACWLDDDSFASGRFAFSTVVPPRPLPSARATASRPTSGAIEIGIGGIAFLVVDGDGERPFPLTLQGDTSGSWVARAVLLRRRGPDQELPVSFSEGGIAHLDLADLAQGDRVVVAVCAVPTDYPAFDQRTLLLRWGVGWVPHVPVDQGSAKLAALVKKALPDGGEAARTRLMATIDRLGGLQAEGAEKPVVTTRYAWAPAASAVVEVLQQEAERRGLPVRRTTFLRQAPNEIKQEWTNVLVELPGSDPRRWPVVLAAHWDGARGDLADSYLRALNLNDDAAGVAVALEAAGAMSRMRHRAPIVVAFLAGGYQGAAGAHALLDQLDGRIAAWIELDGVGVPDRWPRTLTVHLEGDGSLLKFPWSVHKEFRRAGLVARNQSEITAAHTGASLAAERGIAALVLQTRTDYQSENLDTPPAVERGRLSPDLMVLLTKILASTVVNLAGAP